MIDRDIGYESLKDILVDIKTLGNLSSLQLDLK